MKGLERIPAEHELIEAYAWFQTPARTASARELAIASQWSRFDARLAEQWVAHVSRHWRAIPSGELQDRLSSLPWPAAAGVLLEQCAELGLESPAERRAFRPWARSATAGFPPAADEQFFIGSRAFAGSAMREDAERSLSSFRRWGYLGRELLLNKAKPPEKTLLSAEVRRRILDELIRRRPRIRVSDYLDAAEGRVSRRQAQLDLRSHPRLVAQGAERARFYLRR